jgi:hypothetical protein
MASMLDPELEGRRSLLQAASKGSVPARLKLEEEYHVRVYSASECERYAVTAQPHAMRSTVRRKIEHLFEIDHHTEEEQFSE